MLTISNKPIKFTHIVLKETVKVLCFRPKIEISKIYDTFDTARFVTKYEIFCFTGLSFSKMPRILDDKVFRILDDVFFFLILDNQVSRILDDITFF